MTKPGGGAAARQKKADDVTEIRTKLTAADAAVLTEYRGLTVAELAQLRGALRPAGGEYKVFKNTLARRAAEEAGLTELLSLLEGPTAITFVTGDAVIAAKALRDFAKTSPALVVKGGLLGDRVLSPKDVGALADVPPRDVLLARLAGGFQAPMVKAAGLFQAFTRNMAYGVKALIDQRIAGGEEAPAETPATESGADSSADASVETESGVELSADATTPAASGESAAETADTPAEVVAEAAPEAETAPESVADAAPDSEGGEEPDGR